MEKFTFSANLINAILQYLQTKPFAEVNGLIVGIQQEAQANSVPQVPVEMPQANPEETPSKAE